MMNTLRNITIIIPCYEPSEKNFIPYVQELLSQGIENVVIVNDGSGEKYEHIFQTIQALSADKIHYLHYAENNGKGYALKTAFSYCKDAFDESAVFVTADCDGQHRIEDVFKVAEASQKDTTTFVLGVRDFSQPNVPKRSREGNTKTRSLMHFLYGIKLTDTQTGLRGFSHSLLDTLLQVRGNRFEYETQQLISLHQKGVTLKEVEIQTVYEEKAEDVDKRSHYRTFLDSFKVLSVLFKNLGWYFFSSILSSIIDVGAFALLFSVILQIPSLPIKTLVATVTARVLSSIVNFICNYKLVFHSTSKNSIFRYYILWLLQLCASYALANLWAHLIPNEILVSLCKAISDLTLAVFSYLIQSRWVFANKENAKKPSQKSSKRK